MQAWETKSFNTARRTLRGYEARNMSRKAQIQGIEKGDILGQVEYARSNFSSCCITRSNWWGSFVLSKFLRHNQQLCVSSCLWCLRTASFLLRKLVTFGSTSIGDTFVAARDSSRHSPLRAECGDESRVS